MTRSGCWFTSRARRTGPRRGDTCLRQGQGEQWLWVRNMALPQEAAWLEQSEAKVRVRGAPGRWGGHQESDHRPRGFDSEWS